MKRNILAIVWSFVCLGCNMSDDVIDLPGGHHYIIEGSCTNRLSINLNSSCNWIEPVTDCKFNDDFICVVSTDSISCSQDSIPINKRKYTVIDVRKEKVYCYMSKSEYVSFWEKNIRDEDVKLE
ncbi:folate-dependent tRNA-U54 methylase TrmFO/GidA [Arcicella rosea]